MKLIADFPELKALVKRMGAKPSDWRLGAKSLDPLEALRGELEKGKEFKKLADLEIVHGGLFSDPELGEQVVVYIKDTRLSRYILENEPENSRRFHLAECSAIDRMRREGREERYVRTTRKTGTFAVTSTDPVTQKVEELEARLHVCKICLKFIDWKGYSRASKTHEDKIWNAFDMQDFFLEYATFFSHKPKHTDLTAPAGGYVKNWPQISQQRRSGKNWTCDECRVPLSDHKNLIHCHHKNGVLSDNSESNLAVLCAICHSKQYLHGRMKVKKSDRSIIEKKRLALV